MGWSLRWSLGRIGGRGADAVREGFGEMGGSDLVGGVKVGDGLGDFDNFEVAAGGEVEAVSSGV